MSSGSSSTQKKGLLRVWVFFFILITALSIILSLLVDPFWWILLPLSFSLLVVLQLMSRYFWPEKKVCPRCNSPTGRYSEFCRNCGLKLLFKCISCGKYLRANTQFCDNCNVELKHVEEERENFQYQIIERGAPPPEIPEFCSNCGAKLNNPTMIKFCEECGERIK